jgi:hypothetical protein
MLYSRMNSSSEVSFRINGRASSGSTAGVLTGALAPGAFGTEATAGSSELSEFPPHAARRNKEAEATASARYPARGRLIVRDMLGDWRTDMKNASGVVAEGSCHHPGTVIAEDSSSASGPHAPLPGYSGTCGHRFVEPAGVVAV